MLLPPFLPSPIPPFLPFRFPSATTAPTLTTSQYHHHHCTYDDERQTLFRFVNNGLMRATCTPVIGKRCQVHLEGEKKNAWHHYISPTSKKLDPKTAVEVTRQYTIFLRDVQHAIQAAAATAHTAVGAVGAVGAVDAVVSA